MSELGTIHHFTFIAPHYLFALVLVPLLLLFMALVRRQRSKYMVAFTNMDVLAGIVEKRRVWWRRGIPIILIVLALSTAAAALARPQVHLIAPDRNATIILLVDVSGSMRATDVTPTRMGAAVDSMRIFLDKLPKSVKVGLVAFSSDTEVLDTPTTDHTAIDSGLDFLSPEAGTALGDGVAGAVRLAVSSLNAAGVHHKPGEYLPAAIVLESDGAQNRGTFTPESAAKLAKADGVRIYGVALGTNHGKVTYGYGLYAQSIPVPPDPAAVNLLAKTTGGKAFTADTAKSLDVVYRTLGSSIGRHNEVREITSWFAIAAAILLVAGVGIARAWGASLP
ncbi:MAG TPA: VWA domain-containing protein [Gaiellaceae bacterium]|nr:VWA domain-containing protein [Gaiellaceae bacterium]